MHVFGYAQEQKVQKLYRFSTKNGFIFVQSAVMFLQNLILLPYLIFMITRGRDGFNTKKTGLFSQFSQFPFSKPYIFRQCVDLGKFRHFDAKTQKSGAPQHSVFFVEIRSAQDVAPVDLASCAGKRVDKAARYNGRVFRAAAAGQQNIVCRNCDKLQLRLFVLSVFHLSYPLQPMIPFTVTASIGRTIRTPPARLTYAHA